jgi:hypothetical protein
MPVRLTGGGRVTWSVWLRLDDDQLRHAHQVWDTTEYQNLRVRGEVANAIAPWGEMLGESVTAEVREAGTLPYLVGGDGLVARVLAEEWDRDDVLSQVAAALPAPVRQQVTERWSIERTAGLALHQTGWAMRFVGAGRTVHIETFTVPAEPSAATVIAEMSEGLAEKCQGELTERDGGLVRRAFWLTATVDGRPQHELHGYAATGDAVISATCMYDEPSGLAWAQSVWRSVRADQG